MRKPISAAAYHAVQFLLLMFALALGAMSPGAALAQKSFVRDDLASEVVRLEEAFRKDTAALSQGKSVAELKKEAVSLLGRKDPTGAIGLLSAAIGIAPKDAINWYDYGRLALSQDTGGSSENYDQRNHIATAAYAAYQRAAKREDEAQSLSLLGEVEAKRELWRNALDAYRASLALVDSTKVRPIYEAMREEHGFRVLDYKVDNDLASPRVCFQFSEPLARKTDFAPFVAVSGAANAAITTEDQQLCVEALKHGERYAMVLRKGLPSTVGEALLKPADYEIYVRDRSPQVRFSAKSYVLPRVGQEGIPVVSVNSNKIDVEIFRIGDRNLLSTVHSEDFLKQLSGYRAKQIADENGFKVWKGVMDVQPELNKDVVTAFPVSEAVGKLQPGVYVMQASAHELAKSDTNAEEGGPEAATQWFVVSDLGLTTFSGEDGVHVLARSLASAEPLKGVEIRLVARNNEVLATAATDKDGRAHFDPGLSRGAGGMAPGMITATNAEGDYNFLDQAQAGFDLSDRGVKGRSAAKSLDAFVYTERGVYRSGETVFIGALLRDPKGLAVTGLPLTIVAKRPDGVEYKRVQVEDQGLGGRAYSLALLNGAASGTWRVEAYADPKGAAIGEATFLVEDYVPERLDVTLSAKQKSLRSGEVAEIDVDARFLYGAPGANLEVSGEVVVQAAKNGEAAALPGFKIGLEDEAFESVTGELTEKPKTDDKGHATVSAKIPEVTAPKPVEAKIVLRVSEDGGRAVERVVTLPIRQKGVAIGVKAKFDGDLSEGSLAVFDLAALAPDGTRVARKGVTWSLSRVETNYQWFNHEGRWGYEAVKSARKVADGVVDIGTDGFAQVQGKVGWGRHRLDVRAPDADGGQTSVTFSVGWSGDQSAETPDLLDVTLDKTSYVANDQMKLRLKSRFDGKATIAIIGEKIHDFVSLDLKTGDNMVSLPVNPGWGTGAYAVALAHRPLDAAAKRMPGRALGLAWFTIDEAAHKLEVKLEVPAKVRPRTTLELPVTLAGLQAGDEAQVMVAAVDVGILSLTRYEAPNPSGYFFGQRQLSTEIRDLYGLLIDGMQGQRGAIRSGGDAAAKALEGNVPAQEPLARFSGVVKVGADGKAVVSFELPAFNGTVRVMAVAWSKGKTGSASAEIVIRDPVVVAGTLPRFLGLADQSRIHLDIDNVEGEPGDYTLDLDVHGPIVAGADALHKTVKLAKAARTSVTIPITAAGLGIATLDVRLTGPGIDASQTFRLKVQPGTSELYHRTVRNIAPGASMTISSDLLAEFLPGTGAISTAVSPYGAIDVPALLLALDRYPHGCSEQTVSRAMPLLYVNKLAAMEQLALDDKADVRIKAAIETVMSRQDSNGAFGLWTAGGSDDIWLDAYVMDFLTRSREKNFAVPQKGFDQALDRLRNYVVNVSELDEAKASELAYAVYVLARNGRPVMSDLRYLADTKLKVFASPMARAQLAASFALLGDKGRATQVFASALDRLKEIKDDKYSRPDYGSRLRDGAGTLALLAESGQSGGELTRASVVVEDARNIARYTSTQEEAWMVIAAQALAGQTEALALTVNGEAKKGAYYRTFREAALDGKPVTITNNSGTTPARVVLTTSGHPGTPEPAASQGYEVERSFYRLDGKKLDAVSVKQNDRLVVVLKITEKEASYARLILVDHLAAGLEIDNPNLVDSGTVAGLDWLKKDLEASHTEYKDDRFVASFDRDSGQAATFNVAYIVRAVAPGHYVLPPATVEDMYRPERFGRTAYGVVDVAGK